MQDSRRAARSLSAPESGAEITREEIKQILANEGYSADERSTWLKSVLTEVTEQNRNQPSEARRRLIKEVKSVIDKYQSGDPIADEIL